MAEAAPSAAPAPTPSAAPSSVSAELRKRVRKRSRRVLLARCDNVMRGSSSTVADDAPGRATSESSEI